MWVLPSSPVFNIIRPDFYKCVLFRDFLKNITFSEFDREEKPVVCCSKDESTTTGITFFYINTRKGRADESCRRTLFHCITTVVQLWRGTASHRYICPEHKVINGKLKMCSIFGSAPSYRIDLCNDAAARKSLHFEFPLTIFFFSRFSRNQDAER